MRFFHVSFPAPRLPALIAHPRTDAYPPFLRPEAGPSEIAPSASGTQFPTGRPPFRQTSIPQERPSSEEKPTDERLRPTAPPPHRKGCGTNRTVHRDSPASKAIAPTTGRENVKTLCEDIRGGVCLAPHRPPSKTGLRTATAATLSVRSKLLPTG